MTCPLWIFGTSGGVEIFPGGKLKNMTDVLEIMNGNLKFCLRKSGIV